MPTKRELVFVLIGACIAVAAISGSGHLSVSKPSDAPVVVLETMRVTASSDAGGSMDAGLLDAGAAAHLDAGHTDAGIDAGK